MQMIQDDEDAFHASQRSPTQLTSATMSPTLTKANLKNRGPGTRNSFMNTTGMTEAQIAAKERSEANTGRSLFLYLLIVIFFLAAFVAVVNFGVSKDLQVYVMYVFGAGVMGTVITAMILSAH